MKLKRFVPKISLRTLLILGAVLPAAVGLLWRCGQLDVSVGDRNDLHVWSVRAFRCEAILLPGSFHLRWVKSWNDPHGEYAIPINYLGWTRAEMKLIADEAVSKNLRMPRDSHPWTGREFTPSWTCDLISVEWGPSVIRGTQTAAGYWGGIRITFGDPVASIAPMYNRVRSLWPELFDCLGA